MKKTPLRKKAKTKSRGWYNKKLDDIAKGFAKDRDSEMDEYGDLHNVCQYTGQHVEGSNSHGSHVIPVSAGNALRWDLDNIKCLSFHSHMNWWHKNPTEASSWFKEKFPDRWEYLKSMRYTEFKLTMFELVEFYEAARKCKTWGEYETIYAEMLK